MRQTPIPLEGDKTTGPKTLAPALRRAGVPPRILGFQARCGRRRVSEGSWAFRLYVPACAGPAPMAVHLGRKVKSPQIHRHRKTVCGSTFFWASRLHDPGERRSRTPSARVESQEEGCHCRTLECSDPSCASWCLKPSHERFLMQTLRLSAQD